MIIIPVVSDAVVEAIKRESVAVCRITRSSPESVLPLVLDTDRYDDQIRELRSQVGSLEDKHILEVGCGYGMGVIYGLLNYNLDIQGLEPSKQGFDGRYDIAQMLLYDNKLNSSRIQCGIGEEMPFSDESFDVVYSFQVLEHVSDPFQVLSESWRVLKFGGVLYCNAPNYTTFYEGHYNLPWIPGIPKSLARVYIRLWGREPALIDHLNFLSVARLEKWLTSICGFPVESDFGLSDWLERMRSPVFSPYTNPNLVRLVRMGRRLGILQVIAILGRRLKWQDTLRVSIRKP
jgi:SAM-dependent methyltransferase